MAEMKSPFTADSSGNAKVGILTTSWNEKIRHMFSSHAYAVDPSISGYHYLFIYPPTDVSGGKEVFFTILNREVTLVDINVNDITIESTNEFNPQVPGSINWSGKRFSAEFLVTVGKPIFKLVTNWVFMIRDMITGVSQLTGNYTQTKYKGHALYAAVMPDGITVDFAATFTGVYPGNVPLTAFNSARATQDKRVATFEFSFDMMYIGDEVEEIARGIVESAFNDSISKIMELYKQEIQISG